MDSECSEGSKYLYIISIKINYIVKEKWDIKAKKKRRSELNETLIAKKIK